ncbi:hypothetical protein DV737_g1641, partial [Chaetothyriales sp. CBS 132003]
MQARRPPIPPSARQRVPGGQWCWRQAYLSQEAQTAFARSTMRPIELLQSILQAIVRGAMTLLRPITSRLGSLPGSLLPCTDSSNTFFPGHRSLASLATEVDQVFRYPCSIRRMLTMSAQLKRQYQEKLQHSDTCMLPSFCHSLPSGQETGQFLTLDVGGSTFRIALMELAGRARQAGGMVIHHLTAHTIDESVRRLQGTQFFDWMAARIKDVVEATGSVHHDREWAAIPLGLTWSFPLEQTSHQSGRMQGMGKGFKVAEGTLGMDMADLLESACARRGLAVAVEAVINDGAATLLSQAYLDASTSVGLILGTGTNAAVFLPTAAMGPSKFASRDPAWLSRARRVIVNTEMSMFGKGVLPRTRWDEILNKTHSLPDFQPLEYMTTGRYLGELLRLIILDAVETCHLFGGILPLSLAEPYSLDTAILARLEEDHSTDLAASTALIASSFGLKMKPELHEIAFLRMAAQSISHRAAAYLATAMHALWALQRDTAIKPHTAEGTPKTCIACNGSVILKYPGFKDRCESYICSMIEESWPLGTGLPVEKVVLQPTYEAALFGAAVAHCRKVICIGRNYAEHISELSSARPSQPFWFLKPTSSLVLPPSSSVSASPPPKITVPRGVEAAHEIELGLIIGPVQASSSASSSPRQKYRNLNLASLDAALPLIGGYVMGIDVTARNVQWEAKRKGLPWSISKGFDTFLPISRFIPKQRIPNPHDATLWLAVNGEVRQRDSTALFLFDIPRMLSDISKVMTLEEGDIVLTGTPKGVGPLLGGDVVQAGVEVAGEEVPEGRIDVVVEDDTAEGGFVYRET